MCNEFQRTKSLEAIVAAFRSEGLPLFGWSHGRTPNLLGPQPSIRISDPAMVARLRGEALEGEFVKWAWAGPKGAPVFNFRAEGRDFSRSDRVLVMTDGFFEYTTPAEPKAKRKDKHRFKLAGSDWFWLAGIVKDGCFSLLTTAPGPDMAPFHDRQVAPLAPLAGLDWLRLSRPAAEILQPLPAGALTHEALPAADPPGTQARLF
jgi:putative SOS response-associated peptidase YedK